jgi:hypothetical protein
MAQIIFSKQDHEGNSSPKRGEDDEGHHHGHEGAPGGPFPCDDPGNVPEPSVTVLLATGLVVVLLAKRLMKYFRRTGA